MNFSNQSLLQASETLSPAKCTLQAFVTVHEQFVYPLLDGPNDYSIATKDVSYWTGSEVFDNVVLLWIFCGICFAGNCYQVWWLLGSDTIRAVDGCRNYTFLIIDGIVNLLWGVGFILFDAARKSCERDSGPNSTLCIAAAVVSATYVGLSTLVHLLFAVSNLQRECEIDCEHEERSADVIVCHSGIMQRCFHLGDALLVIFYIVFGIVLPVVALMVLVVSTTVAIIFFLDSFFDDYNMLRAAIHTWQMAAGNVMKLSACKFFDAYNVPVLVHGDTYSSPSTPGPYCICGLAIAACVQFVSGIVDSCSSDRKKHREAKAMQIFIALRAILFFVSTMPAVVVWCWWQSERSQLQHNPGSFIYIAKANEVLQPLGPVLAPLLLLVVRLLYFYTNYKRTIQDVKDEELQTLLEPTENTITDLSEEMELEEENFQNGSTSEIRRLMSNDLHRSPDSVAVTIENDQCGQSRRPFLSQFTVSDIGIECVETGITVTEILGANGGLLNADGGECRSFIEFPENLMPHNEVEITAKFLRPKAFDDGYSFSECVHLSSTNNLSTLNKPFTIYLNHWFSSTNPLNPVTLVFTEKKGPRWNVLCPDVLSAGNKTVTTLPQSPNDFQCRFSEGFVVITTTYLGSYTAMCRKCPSSLTLCGQVGQISRSSSILRFQLSKDIDVHPKKGIPASKTLEEASSISFEVDNSVKFPVEIFYEDLSGEWQAQDTDPYIFSLTSSSPLNAQVLFKPDQDNDSPGPFQPRLIVKSRALLYRKREVFDVPVSLTEWNRPSKKQTSRKTGQKLELDDEVNKRDLQKVSRKIASSWERVACRLQPKPFSQEDIETMKRDCIAYSSSEEKAVAMLERWKLTCGSRATVRHLIQGLIDAKFLKFAEDVFTPELTWQVQEEKESSSD